MKTGILFVKKIIYEHTILEQTIQELFLPIFHEDREFVYSVLTDAMEKWKPKTGDDSFSSVQDFYEIADAIGQQRSNSHLFIGPESIPFETLDSIIKNQPYVFTVDYENRKIVSMK